MDDYENNAGHHQTALGLFEAAVYFSVDRQNEVACRSVNCG